MVNEFDRLAVFVCDSDGGSAEKHLSKLKDSELVGLKNVLGQNLLFIAVGADKVKIIEYLLSNNNDPKSKILAPDKSKVTPLHLAAEHKSAKVFRILLSHLPADTNLHEVVDCHKRSILHYAAQNGSFEVCQIIVSEEMMPIDPRDELNQTPLMYAASSNFGKYYCKKFQFK
uniref:Uncharacterized protein n=1 Tax=Panagrolaimus davidi TaxID=227884 RepID=A0A914QUL1_9BILA